MEFLRGKYFAPILLLLVISSLTASVTLVAYDDIILRPVRLPEADDVVLLWGIYREPGMKWPGGWNDGSFYDLGVFQTVSLSVGERAGSQEVRVCLADAPFFRVLQVNPELGRLLSDEDGATGAAPVAVISHSFWKSYFGSVKDLSGTRLLVAGHGFHVVGVLTPGIDFPARSAIYLPRSDEAIVVVSASGGQRSPDDVSQGRSAVIGRLRPGVTLTQARSVMQLLQGELLREN